MTNKRTEFPKGIRLRPDGTTLDTEGEAKYDETAKKIQYRDDVGTKSVVSEDGTQTLENKTIDATSATGNNTLSADSNDIVYDNTISGLTATNVKTAIDELDSRLEGQDEASEISYSNATSGLTATDVQAAIDEVDGNLDTHIADTTAHGTTGNVVGTSDAQTLTNKTIDADSNTISNIDDGEIKAGANINATKLGTGVVDNTEFNRLNGVTGDIQTQLDAKLDDFSSTNDNRLVRTDGTTGEAVQESVVAVTDVGAMSGVTQLDVDNLQMNGNTISSTDTNGDIILDPDGSGAVRHVNKVVSDFSADATSGSNVTLGSNITKHVRLTSGTLASVDMIPAGADGQELVLVNATGSTITINNDTGATAANRILTGTGASLNLKDEASIPLVYDNTEARWMIAAGVGGEGGGTFDIFYQENFESLVAADLTSGNSGTFLGGGSRNGSLNDEVVAPIAGDSSLEYVMGAASTNDYVAFPEFTLEDKQKAQHAAITFYYEYDGDDGDIQMVVWDATNSQNLLDSTDVIATAGTRTRFSTDFYIPASTNSLRVGFQVVTGNNTKEFLMDEFEMTLDPFSYKQLSNDTEWIAFTPTTNDLGTISDAEGFYRRDGDSMEVRASFIVGTPSGGTAGFDIPGGFTMDSAKLDGSTGKDDVGESLRTNGTSSYSGGFFAKLTHDASDFTKVRWSTAASASGTMALRTGSGYAVAGDGVHVKFRVPIEGWEATTEHLVTPAKANLTDWTDGGVITLTAESSNPTKGTTVTDKVFYKRVGSDMHVRMEFEKTGAGGSAVGSGDYMFGIPAGLNIDTTKFGTITGTANNLRGPVVGTASMRTTSTEGSANSAIGSVVIKDATRVKVAVEGGAALQHNYVGSDFINIAGASYYYLEFRVPIEEWAGATNQFLAATPTKQVAYIRDEKAQNTSGGTFTSGSWQTRDLNTLAGDTAFISLSSNQFTLQPGKYVISCKAPAFRVDRHQSRLRNITDSTDDIIGSSEINETTSTDSNVSFIEGTVSINSAKTFELQHRCATTASTQGFGVEANLTTELYSQIKIEKVK